MYIDVYQLELFGEGLLVDPWIVSDSNSFLIFDNHLPL